jgi:L-malate glycosyltransferase
VRVLQVDSGREWRGGQNQVRLLCRELARQPGFDLRLVTKGDGELGRRARNDGIEVRGASWALSLDPRALIRLVIEWARFEPDIVHAHDSHALRLVLWARSLVKDHARVLGTRRVDFPAGRRSTWWKADHVVAISQAVRAALLNNGLQPRQISVVLDGIDPDEVRRAAEQPLHIRARLGLPPSTPLAVNVAALVDHKDQRTLVRAAAAARPLRPDLHWAVAGEGEHRRSLEGEIAELGLHDRVHILGYVREADALIREADVFVLSSKQEGLGSVILNALALGKPVVATAGGGIPEVLPPEALVAVGDYEALARKVVDVLTHPPSPVPLPPRFTASAMAQGVLAVYRSLV